MVSVKDRNQAGKRSPNSMRILYEYADVSLPSWSIRRESKVKG